MVLVDTSIWVDHFRRGNAELTSLLSKGSVLMHPFISGELACGNLRNRAGILSDLNALPCAKTAGNEEVLWLIEDRRLWGKGLGWVDAHLLASSMLSNCPFLTLDGRLAKAALEFGLSWSEGSAGK
jgi:predicted nucleic acid-binding protein